MKTVKKSNHSGPRPVPESPTPSNTFNNVNTGAGVANTGTAANAPAANLATGAHIGVAGHVGGAGNLRDDYLILVLNDNLGGNGRMDYHYKIRPTTKLGKLMRFHCGMMGQTLAWTRFVVTGRGVHLTQSDTAAEMGIVDGDRIMAVFHSYSMVSQA